MNLKPLANDTPRLDQLLAAIEAHDDQMAKLQRSLRAWPERIATWSPVLAVCCYLAALSVVFAAERWNASLPNLLTSRAAVAGCWLLVGSIFLATLPLAMLARQYWQFTMRPMRSMLPRISGWTRLDHALVAKLVEIGALDELRTAELAFSDEAACMERRRAAWFATLGFAAVGGGLSTALAAPTGQSGFGGMAVAAGALMLSNLSAGLHPKGTT